MKAIQLILITLLFSLSSTSYAQTFEEFYENADVLNGNPQYEGDATIVSERVDNSEFHYVATSELYARPPSLKKSLIVTKIDEFGVQIWRKIIYDISLGDDLRSFSINQDDDFVYILGVKSSTMTWERNMVLISLNKLNGGLNFSKIYNFTGGYNSFGVNLMKLNDGTGDFIITGLLTDVRATDITHKDFEKKALALRVKKDGNIVWSCSYNSIPHIYLDNNGSFTDYDKFVFSEENNDGESIYCVGTSTLVETYFINIPVHPFVEYYSNFFKGSNLVKLNKNNGDIIFDKNNFYTIGYQMNPSKVIIDNDKVITLENYSEYLSLVFHDQHGVFLNKIDLVGIDSRGVYVVGVNLLQDNSYYYIIGFNEIYSNLVVFKIDKINYSLNTTHFVNYNSNYNTQTVSDYFTNLDFNNQNSYNPVNSTLQNTYLNIVSGKIGGGVSFVKLKNTLEYVCTNEDILIEYNPSTIEERSMLFKHIEPVTIDVLQLNIFDAEILKEICYNNQGRRVLDVEKKDSLNYKLIFPNPSKDYIYINFNPDLDFKITNVYGEIISDFSTENIGKSLKINISQLPNGIYFIKSESKSLKFIKN